MHQSSLPHLPLPFLSHQHPQPVPLTDDLPADLLATIHPPTRRSRHSGQVIRRHSNPTFSPLHLQDIDGDGHTRQTEELRQSCRQVGAYGEYI